MKLTVPEGARWYKFDFHCHTPMSEDYGKKQDQAILKQRTPKEWLLDYMNAGIDCVAVTDHNTGAWIDTLKAEYTRMKAEATPGFRELIIFPGVEISCQNNVHVLAIFGQEATSETITHLLGVVGYNGRAGYSDEVTDLAVQTVCEKIAEHHGLAILAHIDEPSGAFRELRGTTLESLLKCKALVAVEISDPSYLREHRSSLITPKSQLAPGTSPAPHSQDDTLHQNFRAYEQLYSFTPLAEVVGSDAHHPSGPQGSRFPGCRFTWVKMGPSSRTVKIKQIEYPPPQLNKEGTLLVTLQEKLSYLPHNEKGIIENIQTSPLLNREVNLKRVAGHWDKLFVHNKEIFLQGSVEEEGHILLPTGIHEGLRLALHDNSPLSIRRSDEKEVSFNQSAPLVQASTPAVDPNKWADNIIEDISISEAQYVGRKSNRDKNQPLVMSLSPWLNCIVGGRGSGKSTLVELARLVLRRNKELEGTGEPQRNFQAFAQVYDKRKATKGDSPGALTQNTEISLIYRVGANRYRLHWSQNGQDHSIEEEINGSWKPAQGEITSRFPVRIYSQKQVYSLAQNSTGLLRIIDDSQSVGYAEWNGRWNQELAKFLELRANARRIETGFREQSRLLGLLEDVKKKLKVFEEAGHADVLMSYQKCHRQKLRMTEIIKEVAPLPDNIQKAIDHIQLTSLNEETFTGAVGLDELKTESEKLVAAIEKARSELIRISDELKTALGTFGETVWRSIWAKAVVESEKKFEELKRQLATVGSNDPNEYGRLVQQRQGYEAELKKISDQRQDLQKVNDQAKVSFSRLLDLRHELTKKRSDFLNETLKGNTFVRMAVIPYGNFTGVEETFRSLIGKEGVTYAKDILQYDGLERSGLLAELYKGYIDNTSPNISDFEKKLENLKRAISKAKQEGIWEGKTRPFINHLNNMQPEQLDRVFTWWPEDSLKIEYNNGSSGEKWRSISEGSPGQKTAAMLAFLLSYGTEPMILDQPEDDLDNHLIYNLIVTQIRQNKTKRQIIIVTHNPNIVVNGDAEFVVAMDFRSGQCRVSVSGCLQEKAVRDEICRVMEGGREAFEKRYRRVILENK